MMQSPLSKKIAGLMHLLLLSILRRSNSFTLNTQQHQYSQRIGLPSQLSSSFFNNDTPHNNIDNKQRDTLIPDTKKIRSIILSTTYFLLLPSILLLPTTHQIAHAATDEGASIVTDSNFGKAIRKSTIKGARVIDNLDEKWERFSDSLRDQNKCDEATGRRLYDNGFRKDGTRVGDPVLGALCQPKAMERLNDDVGDLVLEYGFRSATTIPNTSVDSVKLKDNVKKVEGLVRSSFERSITNIDDTKNGGVDGTDDEKRRKLYNFAMYTNLKAINDEFNQYSTKQVKDFYISWGNALVSKLAPNANRNDYSSPFTEMKDEFEDYDYDKNVLLDSLGMLNVALKSLQDNGLIGHYEISIPYDDYGSVVTLAVDDDITLGSQLLLREQGVRMSGSFVEAIVRYVMDRANIYYGLDSFFIDPSTTKQSVYNPTQLLLSLSNLRGKD